MKRSKGELRGHCIYPEWISVSSSSTGVYARAVHIRAVQMLYGNLKPRATEAFSIGIGKANILDPLLEPISQMRDEASGTIDKGQTRLQTIIITSGCVFMYSFHCCTATLSSVFQLTLFLHAFSLHFKRWLWTVNGSVISTWYALGLTSELWTFFFQVNPFFLQKYLQSTIHNLALVLTGLFSECTNQFGFSIVGLHP